MAIPSWTYPSNYDLGTDPTTKKVIPFSERIPVNIPVLVFDNEDYSTPETKNFENAVDSTKLPNYSNDQFFWVKSNGLAQTEWLGQPEKVNKFSPVVQNYVFKFPRDGITINGAREDRAFSTTPTTGFFGIAIDGVPFRSPNSGIIASIGGRNYTENGALFPLQEYQDDSTDPWGYFADGSGIIDKDRKFYYHTDPRFLYAKDPTEHSPIVGYAFDGNPIYGPYGYSTKFKGNWNSQFSYSAGDIVRNNRTANVFYVALQDNVNTPLTNIEYWRLAMPTEPYQVMRSSYKLSEAQRSNSTFPDGTYIEDFEYVAGLGDLDQHNGKFCNETPDYPGGTYAYFITVDPDDINLPRYPYILGPTYYQEPLLPNGNFVFPGEIKLEVISGQLPPGLRIEGLNIIGTPYEVPELRTFRFVLRATNLYGISDRTYTITIDGADAPVWVTPSGDLAVGESGTRSVVTERTLALTSNIGDNAIKLTSIKGIAKNSFVTCKAFPSAFEVKARVQSIDTTNKIVTLILALGKSSTIQSPIPAGTRITFTQVFDQTNLFVLDNSYVNYQLSAIDNDLPTGQKLTYYIPPRGGELPLGLTLSPDGIISGFTQPILANEFGEYNGNYDMQLYDKFAYDYGVRPYNGFDSFLFDNTTFDYSDATRSPRKLNRYYQFRVRVTDGLNYEDRVFRIFVIGDDFFRADTTIMEVGNSTFTSDVTPIRKPFWLTPPYLGRRRANNYITTFLDIYDPSTLRGGIGYILDPVNDDGTVSLLPPGMILDQISGEIYGDVPYQPAITKTYKFTIRAIRYDPDNVMYGMIKFTSGVNVIGQNSLKLDSVLNLRLDSLVYGPSGSGYLTPGTIITAIDAGTRTITLSTPLLKTIPEGERFSFNYVTSAARTFTLDIIGEVDSTIRFTSPGDLGTIAANFISNISVVAVSTVPNAILTYTLVGGRLPPGLTLVGDGTIQGKVQQFSEGIYKSFWKPSTSYKINDIVRYEDKYYRALEPTSSNTFNLISWTEYEFTSNGLTVFDSNDTVLDKSGTTIDRDYSFIVLAQDQFLYSAVTKVFKISVSTPNDLLYSNVYVKPFLKNSKRLELTDFFTNPNIFERQYLYRASDPEFGVQTQLKMLMYAGIETKNAAEYAAALGRSSRKRYRFGSVKKATAKIPGTNTVVYETVYIEVLDNMENSTGTIPSTITTRYLNRTTPPIKHTVGVNIKDQNKITLDSVEDLNNGDPIIGPNLTEYISEGTIITGIDRKNKIITISKPLINSIPQNTHFTFNTGGVKTNQGTRDLWDSSITDSNLSIAALDQLQRIWMQDKVMTADFDGQLASDLNKSNVFGNSTTNLRKNIQTLGETERNFLPLWMRTAQSFSGVEQGFTKAIVLCYVIPGYGDRIINNIKNLGIDFKNIDFTVDRVIIDSVKGEVGDKYIAFGAREIING